MAYQSSPRYLAPIAIGLVMAALIFTGSFYLGVATMVVIGGSAIIAYIIWLNTAWRRPIDPALVTVPYLALIAMELIHMAEEQLTDFPGSLARIFPIPHTFNLLTHAVLLMGFINAVAILASLGIRSRTTVVRQAAGFFVWFYVIGPGLVNAVAHVTFPFLAHTFYFSGLITVALPTIAGVITLRRLIESDRTARSREILAASGARGE
jgi:hypothetical protein